jgi:hypothetical protein
VPKKIKNIPCPHPLIYPNNPTAADKAIALVGLSLNIFDSIIMVGILRIPVTVSLEQLF